MSASIWGPSAGFAYPDFLNVKAYPFFAKGDGVTDDTAAIQAAINAAYKRTLLFPTGIYKITSALNVITDGIRLLGEQFGNAVLIQYNDNTPFIKIGDGTLVNRVTRSQFENLIFLPRPGSANWTSAYAIEAAYASFLNFVNLDIYGIDGAARRLFGGIKLDRVSFSNIYECWARGIKGNGVFTVGASGNLTADIRIQNTYITDFEGNGLHFSDFTNGHFVINPEIVTSIGQNGVYVDSNPATGGSNFFFTNLNMELSGTTCDGVTLNRGSLIQFQDGWWGASAGKSAVRIAPGVSNVTFNGPWTTEGRWLVEGTNVKVHGPGNIGSLVPAASPAMTIVGATSSIVDVNGMAFSQFTNGGIATTGTPADINIQNNDFTSLGGGVPISGNFGARSQITNNRGDTVRGAASAITVTASPFTYTAGPRPEFVNITGGTVSSIVINGVTVASATNQAISLPPNTAVTVTYSSTPTMIKTPQ